MGTFSKLHRYHEKGEGPNVVNTENFGEPYRSLYTSTRLLTLHHEIDITDDDGNVVYLAGTKFFSILDKTDIYDAEDRHVAHIERKLLSLHERHYVSMEDGQDFEVSNELFHLVDDITNIEGLGWRLVGNILALNFALYDDEERVVALISQKMLSLHDKYCIDIYQPEHEKIVVTIVITLQHMIRDRQAASSAASSSSSSSN